LQSNSGKKRNGNGFRNANNDKIEVSARYNQDYLVGGDYYDFIELNSEEVAFCIADVSGKGAPAALLMSNSSQFKSINQPYSLFLGIDNRVKQ
jgi:serine phosphatase RsbU (regulator of sigma subunit)